MVVGHSFGCAIALQLAASRPDLVAGLVLLDPAVGLDGGWMREIADAMFASPDYTDAAEARNEKSGGAWSDVDAAELDAEVSEHLIDLPNGRVGWRVSIPAMMSYWSELGPRYRAAAQRNSDHAGAGEADIAAVCHRSADRRPCATVRAPASALVDVDCNHMVPHGQTRRDRTAHPRSSGAAVVARGHRRSGGAGTRTRCGHSVGPGRDVR